MAPHYKLTYFDLTGLGEPIRYLLNYGNIPFEDVRIPKSSWPDLKDTLNPPLGQLPLLEVDGEVLFQSIAISRYVGTVVGLAGSNPLENWQIDAAVDTVFDLRIKIFNWYTEQNEELKKELKETLVREQLPYYLSKFDEWAKKYNGYLAVGKLTWVDLYFIAIIDFLDEFLPGFIGKPSLLTGYSNLEALKNTVTGLPQIKKWLETRPKSEYLKL
ncbi:glutathione S-transferase-like [Anthonomus grandis grandis]|uniref:glutathione S-transferase-like n=1 Tax=Anthonomus grandis grandis TaxID=2921223 RepID=UPI0021655BDA|nr:glutathione S-transferase-like [Anthonomus grandis grandis]